MSNRRNGRHDTNGDSSRFDSYVCKSLAEVGFYFGVSTQTVSDWRENGMPGERRSYPLKDIIRWRRDRDIRNAENNGTAPRNGMPQRNPDSISLQQQKLQIELETEAERRDKLRRENAEAEGRLLDSSDVLREIAAWAVWLRSQIMQIPTSITAVIPEELRVPIRTQVEHRIRIALGAAMRRTISDRELDEMIVEAGRVIESVPDTCGNSGES